MSRKEAMSGLLLEQMRAEQELSAWVAQAVGEDAAPAMTKRLLMRIDWEARKDNETVRLMLPEVGAMLRREANAAASLAVKPCPDCGSERVDCDCDEINAGRGATVGGGNGNG